MKVAIINDTHFGARNDSPIFLEYFMRFWRDTFFPYLKEKGITRIVHLGDFLDRRKYVNFHTLNMVRTQFLEPMHEMGLEMDITLGNHDVFFKNTNRLNSVVELFYQYPNIRIHEKPTVLDFGDNCMNVGLVPWITKDNMEECSQFMKTAPVRILMGHFEISGFEVMRGVEHQDGMDRSVLAGFEAVYSGHFHCRHSKDNIHYLGTQYQMTFTDLNDRKGFHVFDTCTGEMQFVENPCEMFHQIEYDDSSHDYGMHNCKQYKDTYVRLVVKSKMRPIMYDSLIDRLNDAPVHALTVVDQTEKEQDKTADALDVSKDTLTLICEEIDKMEGVLDPVRLKTLVKELYGESLQS